MLSFTVPGAPVGKGRPRVSTRAGFARLYTPEKTASYEGTVSVVAQQAMQGRELFTGAVYVLLAIIVAVPASWSQRKQREALAGVIRPTTKPDIDNVEKIIFDGCNGVVWRDDVQVVEVSKAKHYGATPRVEVLVEALLEQVLTQRVGQGELIGVVA